MTTTLHTVEPGATVEVSGHTVGDAPRIGEIVEVLGEKAHPHYRVRWADGHETMLYPGSDVRVRPAPAGSERELRGCHGYTVDTDRGHLGSVLHVRKARSGELELHVATPDGVVRVPRSRIRHFDAHEKRIAVEPL